MPYAPTRTARHHLRSSRVQVASALDARLGLSRAVRLIIRACRTLNRCLALLTLIAGAAKRTIAAHPDTGPSPHSKNQRGHGHGCLALLANAREAILRCAPLSSSALLVARRAGSNSAGHGRAPRISGEALAGIILCSTIVFCAVLGCVMQLPAVCLSLHWRLFGSGRASDEEDAGDGAGSGAGGSSGRHGFFDVEMGDEPASFAAEVSPPPPYSRAPSYEGSGSGGAGVGAGAGAGGRGGCPS